MKSSENLSIGLLQSIHHAIRAGLAYRDILEIVTRQALVEVGPPITQAVVYEVDEHRRLLNAVAVTGFETAFMNAARALPVSIWPQTCSVVKGIAEFAPELAFFQSTPGLHNQVKCAMDIPLRDDSGLIGILSLYSTAVYQLPPDVVDRGGMFGLAACIGVETAQIFKMAQTRTVQADAISQIAKAVNANLELEAILTIVVQEITHLIPHVRASLALPIDNDPEHLRIRPLSGLLATESENGRIVSQRRGGIGYAFDTGRPFVAPDLAAQLPFPFDAALYQDGIRSYICFPLVQEDRVVGTLNLGSDRPHAFDPQALSILEQIGEQIAIALRNAHLLALTSRRIDELNLLNDVGRALGVGSLNTERLLTIIHEQTQKLFDTDNLYIALYHEETKEIEFALMMDNGRRLPPFRKRLPHSLTQYIINSGKSLFLSGRMEAHTKQLHLKPGGRKPKIWLGVPMLYNQQVIGVISVQHYHDPQAFKRDQLRLLEAIANQAAIALQNARLFEEQQQRATEESARRAVLAAASKAPDWQYMLNAMLAEVLHITDMEAGWIFLCLGQSGTPELVAHRGLSASFVRVEMQAAQKCGICRQVMNQTIPSATVKFDKCQYITAAQVEKENLNLHASVPIRHQDKVVGIINIASRQKGRGVREHIPLLEAIGREIGAAVLNAYLFKTVRRERRKLEAVLDDTADLVIVLDDHGRIVLINQAVEKYLKVLPHNVENLPLADLAIPDLMTAFAAALEKQAAVTQEIVVSADCILNASVSPVKEVGWVMVMQDITGLKELDRLRQEWIAAVSHDLKNPLSTVTLSTDLLERAGPLNDKQQVVVERIRSGTRRLYSLVTDVLDLARLEAGPTIRCEPVNLGALITQITEELSLQAGQKGQQLVLHLPPHLPDVAGDEVLLRRALANLLGNAIKYTPENGRIAIQLHHRENIVQVDIRDNGPGIPQNAVPQLFERFYRVKPENLKISGTGLGLNITRTIVEKHGGEIWVVSEPGHGSTFSFTVPLVCAPAAALVSGK